MSLLSSKDKRQRIRDELYEQLAKDGVGIPETIKSLRKILKQNQEEFAAKMGLSLSTLRRIEQGHLNFKVATLQKILDKFGLTVVVKK